VSPSIPAGGGSAGLLHLDAQNLLPRRVQQEDAALQVGGQQAAPHGLDDVLIEGLQVFQPRPFVQQLHAGLAQALGQVTGEIPNAEEGEKVDAQVNLQGPRPHHLGVQSRNRFQQVGRFHQAGKQQEGQRRQQERPHAREQDAGHDDDQQIEKHEVTLERPGDVDQRGHHQQVHRQLQVPFHIRVELDHPQDGVEQRQGDPQQDEGQEILDGDGRRGELADHQLNPQQEEDDQDPDFDQPGKPVADLASAAHESAPGRGCRPTG